MLNLGRLVCRLGLACRRLGGSTFLYSNNIQDEVDRIQMELVRRE